MPQAMRSTDRARNAAYTDFAELVFSLRDAVSELRRAVKPAKEDALLTQHRVRILKANSRGCVASVLGDSGTYRVRIYREGSLIVRECSCEGGSYHPTASRCSHVKAVSKVYQPEDAS